MPHATGIGVLSGSGCSAHVDMSRAPKGKLDALVALVDSHDLTKPVNEPQWLSANHAEAAARRHGPG